MEHGVRGEVGAVTAQEVDLRRWVVGIVRVTGADMIAGVVQVFIEPAPRSAADFRVGECSQYQYAGDRGSNVHGARAGPGTRLRGFRKAAWRRGLAPAGRASSGE